MSQHIKSDLPAYFNEDLSETKKLEVEKHLGDCSSCRHAANKLRAKASRVKRQALKSAIPDRVPNLLLTRLVRQTYNSPRASSFPWFSIFVVVAIIAAGGWFIHRPIHWKAWKGARLLPLPSAPIEASTPVAAGFDVEHSSTAALRNETNEKVLPSVVAVSTPETSGASLSGVVPQWGGDESNIKDERQLVIRSRSSWRALWKEMGQSGSAPRVDFNDFVIVGIFAGERAPGQYQISFGAPIDEDDAVIIPYKILGPLASATTSNMVVHPYLLNTIQRSPKPVRFRLEAS